MNERNPKDKHNRRNDKYNKIVEELKPTDVKVDQQELREQASEKNRYDAIVNPYEYRKGLSNVGKNVSDPSDTLKENSELPNREEMKKKQPIVV